MSTVSAVGYARAYLLKVRDRGQLPASSWLPGDVAADRVFATPLLRLHDRCRVNRGHWSPNRDPKGLHCPHKKPPIRPQPTDRANP
jgi:hypothetical protein